MKKKNMVSILVSFFIHKIYDNETLEYRMFFMLLLKSRFLFFLQTIVVPEEKVVKYVKKTVNV